MIKLERTKNKKWIFQKNISSFQRTEIFLQTTDRNALIDKPAMITKLRDAGAYAGRTAEGSVSTIGVRFSQMCFYMFGHITRNNIFMPTQTTINLQNKTSSALSHCGKNMLVNLFSIQFPHPYSKTPNDIKIFAGRLITKILCDDRIERRIYIDEFIYFLPFLKTIDDQIYEELISSIIEFRACTYDQKKELFNSILHGDELWSNCLHEFNYYFFRFFRDAHVFKIIGDKNHNEGKLFKFKHGSTSTYRNDAYESGKKYSGYVQLDEEIYDDALNLLSLFRFSDSPTAIDDNCVFSRENLITDLYENEFIKYLTVVFPHFDNINKVINSISNMTYMSKYSGIDGKDFEHSLKPVFELFNEMENVEIISGAGETDLLCAVRDMKNKLYKINIEAKSRKSSNSLNAQRIVRHLTKYSSKYCIVIAPRFFPASRLDIKGENIVFLTADSLAKYCSKECLSSTNKTADYEPINKIINLNMGTDISEKIEQFINKKYGISI